MRLYDNLYEATKETQRNLWEMGIEVKLKSFQNKELKTQEEIEQFTTKEIQGEVFTILNPLKRAVEAYNLVYKDRDEEMMNWVHAEFQERINPSLIDGNPGEAWKLRADLWTPLMVNGRFEYTYNERIWFNNQLGRIISNLAKDLHSRRQVLQIYQIDKDQSIGEETGRVPCSIDYSFLIRNGELQTFYHMRSCDFYSHFVNDMYLAGLLSEYMVEQINLMIPHDVAIKSGKLTVLINSLHAYRGYMVSQNIF
jgi:thymidylate synthase